MVNNKQGIKFFDRYLTVWVLLCMGLGIILGKYVPGFSDFRITMAAELNDFTNKK